VVGHDTSREDWRLLEIFSFIDYLRAIDVEVADHPQDFIDFALFDLLKQCLMDLVEDPGGLD